MMRMDVPPKGKFWLASRKMNATDGSSAIRPR
jgi:hypothetical protein